MRRIFLLLSLVVGSLVLKAQTTDNVNFTFVPDPITNTVAFTNTTVLHGDTNLVRKAFWSFGDGIMQITAPLVNTTHHYNTSGTYTTCLKIYKYHANSNDSVLTGQECKQVVLTASSAVDSCRANYETASITASTLGRKFIALPWHSNGKKPVRICWTFGDGKDTCIEYSTAFAGPYFAEHVYAAAGNYQVCVKIKYDGGCEKQKCEMVLIQAPPPTADSCTFTLNEAATNTANPERKFYVGLMPNRRPERICWNFGDGTDTCVILANPLNPQQLLITHHYPAPGNYTVCAKVYYVGCSVQRCRPVSITVPNSSICGGYLADSAITATTIHFRGTGIQNAPDYVISYNWAFGDGTTASGQQATHTYAAAGNYQACLYLKTASGCETRICKPLRIAGATVQQLVLTPNPVVNTLHALFISSRTESVAVKIFNANGLLTRSYTRFAVTGANNWEFDLATLPTGVYSVVVQSAYQFATAIFFKQ